MLSQRGHCLKVGNLALFQLCICRFKYHLYANDSKFHILSQNAATELQTRVAAAYGAAPMWTSSWCLPLKESRASLMVVPPPPPTPSLQAGFFPECRSLGYLVLPFLPTSVPALPGPPRQVSSSPWPPPKSPSCPRASPRSSKPLNAAKANCYWILLRQTRSASSSLQSLQCYSTAWATSKTGLPRTFPTCHMPPLFFLLPTPPLFGHHVLPYFTIIFLMPLASLLPP